jgi:hypothetical protein
MILTIKRTSNCSSLALGSEKKKYLEDRGVVKEEC